MGSRITRGRFLRTAGIAAAGVGATMMGLGGVAHALPPGNPDPGHIKGPDNMSPAQADDLVMYVYPRDQSKPIPNIGDYRDALNVGWAVENVRDGGIVNLMTTDPNGKETKRFNFGDDTVKVLGKSVKIVGIPGSQNNKPLILGSSPGICYESSQSGVFHVEAPDGWVEIRNLQIIHHYDYATTGERYGSGTIIGSGANVLQVMGCDIDTNATSAIPLRTMAIGKTIEIRDCTIKGRSFTVNDAYAGNYSSINVGSFGMVDMRGGRFEVVGCHMDSALFIGVALFQFMSDSYTSVIIDANRIGHNPTSPTESTSFGIVLGIQSFNKGTTEIVANQIQLDRYYVNAPASVGVVVQANGEGSAEIRDNTIVLHQTTPPSYPPLPPEYKQAFYHDGIAYEDLASKDSVARADISNNTISSTYIPAWRGITLGMKNAFLQFLVTGAFNANVYDNHYDSLNATVAKLYIGPNSENNTVNEQYLTCQDIYIGNPNNTVVAGGVNCQP